MNTCRKVSHMSRKEAGSVYLTVSEGAFVRAEHDNSSVENSDYVIYTHLQGSGSPTANTSMGIMRMASAIDV